MHFFAQSTCSGPVRVVVDVADHIDDFAADGNFFTRRFARLAFVFFALVAERRKRCKGSRGGERNKDVQLFHGVSWWVYVLAFKQFNGALQEIPLEKFKRTADTNPLSWPKCTLLAQEVDSRAVGRSGGGQPKTI